mgnify:CR=1 FL=1
MEFDYEKGGEEFGVYYPPLKPVAKAIKFSSVGPDSAYYHYEPGNGTRYEVVFVRHLNGYSEVEQVTMAVTCPRNAAMIVPEKLGMYSLGYMQEKLKMLEGDCYALIPLVNYHMERP